MNKRIEEIRKYHGLSRASFGERIGVSGDVINNLERGRVDVKDHIFKLICTEFNVNEDWLRTGEGEMLKGLDMENELMAWAGRILGDDKESFKKKFVKMLMTLDEDQWELLAKFASVMVEEKKD